MRLTVPAETTFERVILVPEMLLILVPAGTPVPVTTWPATKLALLPTVTTAVPFATELRTIGATKNGIDEPPAVVACESVMVVAVSPVMIVPAGIAPFAVSEPPAAMVAEALLLKVICVALFTLVIVVPAGMPAPVTTIPTPRPAVASRFTVGLPAVIALAAAPVKVMVPPTLLMAEPTVRPLVLATVMVFEPGTNVPRTGTGPKVVAVVAPVSTPTPEDKVRAVPLPMAVMVVPEGMLALPKIAWPTIKPAVLFIAVTAVVPAAVVATCWLAGVSVSVLEPDFTSVSAPVPLSMIWLLMVSAVLL